MSDRPREGGEVKTLDFPTTTVPLTWREKTVIRILTIIALMLSQDEKIAREIHALATHVAVSKDESGR